MVQRGEREGFKKNETPLTGIFIISLSNRNPRHRETRDSLEGLQFLGRGERKLTEQRKRKTPSVFSRETQMGVASQSQEIQNECPGG